jgi:hypothetical protein
LSAFNVPCLRVFTKKTYQHFVFVVHFSPWGEVLSRFNRVADKHSVKKVEGRAIVRIGRRDRIIRIQVLRAIIATIVSIATDSRNAKARIETLKQQPSSFY